MEEQKEAVKTPVFDDSDIILEEELETDEPEDRPEENAPIMEKPEDMGSTRISVSYTHLDVYKRQTKGRAVFRREKTASVMV